MLRSNAHLLTGYCKQVYRDKPWASSSRQSLLPDRDAITSNAWNEAYSLSLTSSLEDEEGEGILWPRGVGTSCSHVGSVMISDISSPNLTGIYELGGIRDVV